MSQAQALRSGADAQNTQKSVSISSCVRDEGVCVFLCVCAYTMYITLAPGEPHPPVALKNLTQQQSDTHCQLLQQKEQQQEQQKEEKERGRMR